MGWLLSLSLLSVLFACSIVAAKDNLTDHTNLRESTTGNPGWNWPHNGNDNSSELGSVANQRVAGTGKPNNDGLANGNSDDFEPEYTETQNRTGKKLQPKQPSRNSYWPVYHCREVTQQYGCIFHNVFIEQHNSNAYFGHEDVASNNAKSITFKNSTMRKLPAALLNSFREVELLNLNDLQIAEIEPYAFSNGVYIRELYMGFNAIRELPATSFYNMRYLSKLVLDRNNLSSLPENIFYGTPKLTVLSIANNNLDRIEDNTFNTSKSLEQLILSSNKLTHIDLSMIPNLFHGNVSSNLLTKLSIPEKVVELDASHNRINTVTIRYSVLLERLFLQHNKLTSIAWLKYCSSLVKVDLSYNELEKITYQNFPNTTNLKELNLSNNRLVALSLTQNRSPPLGLKILDVSHNHLLFVERNQPLFDKLEELYLDHNTIVTLKLSPNNALKKLTLSHNDFDCKSLDELFPNVPVSVRYGNDSDCKYNYHLRQNICCKESDKPYLDRLIQYISLISIVEKNYRAQGRCSATDALSSVQNLTQTMVQQGGGEVFKTNPKLRTEIIQLNAEVVELTKNRTEVEQKLQTLHTEIDNTLRQYRVIKDGLVHPSHNLHKVFEHLNSRREFKANETITRESEANRKKEEEITLTAKNADLKARVEELKKKLRDTNKASGTKQIIIHQLEAKHNKNAIARQRT